VYPVSAVLANKDVMHVIKPGEHGSTYGGYVILAPPTPPHPTPLTLFPPRRNPLGCAIAITSLQVLIDEKLAQRATTLGEWFRSSIRDFNHPLVKEVRGRGLLNAVVIDEEKSRRGRTAWQLCLVLKSRGVLAKPTHVNM